MSDKPKKHCCEKFKRKDGKTCSRCPLAFYMSKSERKHLRKELRKQCC